jgi:hypothetical protein
VAECAADNWQIQFCRVLCPEAQAEWVELQGMLQGVSLTSMDDEISWGLTASRKFTTSSLYMFLTSRFGSGECL